MSADAEIPHFFCNRSRGKILVREVLRPRGRLQRARMMLGRRLEADVGVLFDGIDRIHTIGSPHRVDVMFFDADLRVVSLARDLARWRSAAAPTPGVSVLITQAGRLQAQRVEEGDLLEWLPPTSERIQQGARPWCEDLLPAGLKIDVENRRLRQE